MLNVLRSTVWALISQTPCHVVAIKTQRHITDEYKVPGLGVFPIAISDLTGVACWCCGLLEKED